MTVKELEEALSRVENKDIEVIMYDEMFGGAEIEALLTTQKNQNSISKNV